MHTVGACLLKMDLEDFFPSIALSRVIGVFRGLGYPPNISFYLGALTTVDGALPQGAPTSPALSNVVAYKLDCRLSAFCKGRKITYTRYADDLTFSGADIGGWHIDTITKIVADEGFRIQGSKTRLKRTGGVRVVTGLSVSGRVRVRREFRRDVRQRAHYVIKYGYFSYVKRKRIRNPYALESLIGKLEFWRSVEPESLFVSETLGELRSIQNRLEVD
jgi:hypothetical protein